MKSGLDEAQTEISIAGRSINNLRYTDDTIPMAESKEFFDECEKKKNWLKTQHSIHEGHGIQFHQFMANR